MNYNFVCNASRLSELVHLERHLRGGERRDEFPEREEVNAGSSPPFAWVPASAAPSRLEITARCREANRMVSTLLGCELRERDLVRGKAVSGVSKSIARANTIR